MLNRILNHIEARRMKKAARVFAFIENRIDDMLEESIQQGVEVASRMAVASIELEEIASRQVRVLIANHHFEDFDEIAQQLVSEEVNNYYFNDFDDMAREGIDELLNADLDVDNHAREMVEEHFDSNPPNIDAMVQNALRIELEGVLDNAPHIVARLEQLETQNSELAERLAQVAANAAGCLELLDEKLAEIPDEGDIARIARETSIKAFAIASQAISSCFLYEDHPEVASLFGEVSE